MRLLVGAVALLAVSTVANAAEPVVAISPEAQRALLASNDPLLAANKKLVWDMWRNFLQAGVIDDGRYLPRARVPPAQPECRNGPRRGQSLLPRGQPPADRRSRTSIDRLVSIVAERDLVVLALVREGMDKDGKRLHDHWFDMFRVANGKIVEHWDTATKP